jgi:hypothetical protein
MDLSSTAPGRPASRQPGRSRPGPGGWLAALLILTVCCLPGQATAGADNLLEDLHYRVNVLLWQDAIRARLTLKSLGPGKYQAEVSGAPRGMLKSITGERRDSYRTEMVWRDGRLLPLVYREESRRKGKRHLKEYRFDYARGKLEMWQWKEGKGMVLKWHTALSEPIYDPLSAFYNCRLGFLGPIRDGQVFKLRGIPYPKPEEIEVRIGEETGQGLKTMISFFDQASKKPSLVYAFLDGQRVPRQAWTRVLGVGTISGELLPGGKGLKARLPGLAAGGVADRRYGLPPG